MTFGIPLIDDALEITVKTRALTDNRSVSVRPLSLRLAHWASAMLVVAASGSAPTWCNSSMTPASGSS